MEKVIIALVIVGTILNIFIVIQIVDTIRAQLLIKLKDPTWSASLRGVLSSVTLIIFVPRKKQPFGAIIYTL